MDSIERLFVTASQAWCLARFFSLLLGDMVPISDAKWDNFLNLLRIMEYAFAPVITADQTVYLELLIEQFLSNFVKLYPWRPLVPKMHYLVHVPMWIRRYIKICNNIHFEQDDCCRCGPLVHAWCMRYEAKNKYFKKMAQVIGNYKNIEKTVAGRHQRLMCYKMSCTDFLGGNASYGIGMCIYNQRQK